MHEKQFYGRGPDGFHRIAYTEWGQESAQPPVICVHGLTRNARDFDYLAHALEGDGRQIFCPILWAAARATGSPMLSITITHDILPT